jgi:hypothetical protein
MSIGLRSLQKPSYTRLIILSSRELSLKNMTSIKSRVGHKKNVLCLSRLLPYMIYIQIYQSFSWRHIRTHVHNMYRFYTIEESVVSPFHILSYF